MASLYALSTESGTQDGDASATMAFRLIPEPASVFLLGVGALLLRRRRRTQIR